MHVMKAPPDQCRCIDALLIGPNGIVTRVQSCPVCIGRALVDPLLTSKQMDLFEEGECSSVSAVLPIQMANSEIRSIESVSDGLPF